MRIQKSKKFTPLEGSSGKQSKPHPRKHRALTGWIIGIDEVGRGPLAGPVTVATMAIEKNFNIDCAGLSLKDSKQLSFKQREEWFKYFKKHPKIFYTTSSVSAIIINQIGIQRATKLAVRYALKRLINIKSALIDADVLLDGLLYAPKRYRQQTIIGGDRSVPIIAAASIMAKVTRDRKMLRFSNEFPEYSFNKHKGYGTKIHKKALQRYGLSEIHRILYCKTFLTNR